MKWFLISFAACHLLTPYLSLAEDAGDNYCHDNNADKEWKVALTKYPDDLNVQALHALRVGICTKIDNGDITLDKGIEIYDSTKFRLLYEVK